MDRRQPHRCDRIRYGLSMTCWAKGYGECRGAITGEHWIPRGIATGPSVDVRGLTKFGGETRTIGWSSALSNMLCERHNNEDASRLDQEAIRLKRSIESVATELDVCRPGELWRGPKSIELPFDRLARWMTKTWCNFVAANGGSVMPAAAAYAMGTEAADVRMFPYLRATLNTEVMLDTVLGHIGVLSLEDENGPIGFQGEVFGLRFLVVDRDLRSSPKRIQVDGEGVITSEELKRRVELSFRASVPGHGIVVVAKLVIGPEPAS